MTAHQTDRRSIPRMRTPPAAGPGALSVTTVVVDRIATVTVRGSAAGAALDPLLAALDAVLSTGVRGVVLDGTRITDWSRRILEVGVHSATRARARGMGFAMCGLPGGQLDVLRQQWPGVRSDRFAFADDAVARSTLGTPSG